MTFGFAPPPAPDSPSRLGRTLEPAEWAAAGIPLLRDPRETVSGLCDRHAPQLSTAVVAVMGPDERLVASASFAYRSARPDGWEFRNALLGQLRRVIPHDLRRRSPVRTAILLYCRTGEQGWTDIDGAWMWGLRDACTLHGVRCGAYITLTRAGWQVFGEGRGGRRPAATVPTQTEPAEPMRSVRPTESEASSDVVAVGQAGAAGDSEPAGSGDSPSTTAPPPAPAVRPASPPGADPGPSAPGTVPSAPSVPSAPAARTPGHATPLGVSGARVSRRGTSSTPSRSGIPGTAAAARVGTTGTGSAGTGAAAEAAAS